VVSEEGSEGWVVSEEERLWVRCSGGMAFGWNGFVVAVIKGIWVFLKGV
jgi:hypothetical protein